MEPFLALLPFFLTSGLAALSLGLAFVFRRQRLQAWQDAAAACGLQTVEISSWRRRLTARAGSLEVGIETCGNKGRRTRIIVRIQEHQDFHDVSIRREPLFRPGQEIEIGDHSFDGTFLIEGPMPQVLALLDAEMRRLIGQANSEGRLEISGGVLQVEDLSDKEVPGVLPLLLDLARRLSLPVDVPRRLAENARQDPEPGVRLRNLLVLARELPGEPGTVEALRTACSDSSPQVRLRAAQELGAEGRDVLLSLTESLEDDAVSAAAVAILDRTLPFEHMKSILDRALEGRRTQTARVCLEALGRSGDTEAAETVLLQALQREEADLRLAAANALGRVGSAAAVLPLQETAEGSWLDLEIRRTARQAIAEIQSRLQGASPGQLSLAPSEGGQLSLASSEAGQVSLAVEPFPLPPEEPEPPSHRAREEPAGRRV